MMKTFVNRIRIDEEKKNKKNSAMIVCFFRMKFDTDSLE